MLRRLPTVLLAGVAALAVVVGAIAATGRAAYVVTHGVSMNPVYYQGDLVIVTKADSYQVGQIVAYRVPAEHLVVLHRIIGRNATGFVMKGDNNQSIDIAYPTSGQIIGRAALHIPGGGRWVSGLTSPAALALIAFALIAFGGAAGRRRRSRRRAGMSRRIAASPTALPKWPLAPPSTTPAASRVRPDGGNSQIP